MDSSTQRQKPMYRGELTNENICKIFSGAGDFVYRPLKCGGCLLHTYAIDGLISGADTSEYIFKPLVAHTGATDMGVLYTFALEGMVYNAVADPCRDLDSVALKLVNGFCVVLFPGIGAIALR